MSDLRTFFGSLTDAPSRRQRATAQAQEMAQQMERTARHEAIRTYGNRLKTRDVIDIAMPRETFRMLTRIDKLDATLSYETVHSFTVPEFSAQPQQLITQLHGNELFLTHREQSPRGAFNTVKQLQGVIEYEKQGMYMRVMLMTPTTTPTACPYQRVEAYHLAQFTELRQLAETHGQMGQRGSFARPMFE